jgi:hypothetical protein
MPTPASHQRTTAADLLRRFGVRPALGLALTAVLGTHLWVLDAWSLPAEAPAVVLAAPRTMTTLPVPQAVEALAAAPAPAVAPVMVSVAVPLLPRPHPRRPVQTPSAAPVAAPAADTPPTPPVTTFELASAQADDSTEPRLLALASVGGGATRTTPAAAASNALTTPPSVRLLYRMKKGPLAGTGQIDWQRDAGTYRMRLEARVPVFGQIFMETSEGRLDASGLAPLRHTERRLKRSERALSFVRDQGPPRILFSAREGDEPLHPGAQDRLSWIAQLATRMAAPPAGEWRAGSSIEMDVASTGGDVQRWVFTVQGQDSTGLWQLRREPDSPHDTRAEVWIDARQHHWPVRIRLSEPSGDPLELTLDGLQPT